MPTLAAYTGRAVVSAPLLERQLGELDGVLDFLEQMNVRHRTEVPLHVTRMLEASGLTGTTGLDPIALMPRVLDRQRLLRRQLASMRRASANQNKSGAL